MKQPYEPDPFGEELKVNPIEREKKKSEDAYEELPPPSKPLLITMVLSSLINFLKPLLSQDRNGSPATVSGNLGEHIEVFRSLLLDLTHQDLSHDPSFAEQLSEAWHHLLVDTESASPDIPPAILMQLKFFIVTISHFPPGEEHSLGFYLTEYAGKDWIPFPFMDILQALHREFLAAPNTAPLTQWITILNQIL